MQGVLDDLGPPHFDDEDKAFAEAIRKTLTPQEIAAAWRGIGHEERDVPLADFTVPLDAPRNPMIGSTDVGDVSWVVPTVQAHAPTEANGTPFHTWQIVAQGKQPAAHKAMVQVSKAMAALGARALQDPALVDAAKGDLARRTAKTPYRSPLPPEVNPPLDSNG